LPAKRILAPEAATVASYWQACAKGAEFLPYYLGRIADAHETFLEIEGFLNDGPEFGYEIVSGFLNDNLSVFAYFGSCCKSRAGEPGCGFRGSEACGVCPVGMVALLERGGCRARG